MQILKEKIPSEGMTKHITSLLPSGVLRLIVSLLLLLICLSLNGEEKENSNSHRVQVLYNFVQIASVFINSLICLSLEICKRAFSTSVHQKQFLEFIEFIPSLPTFHQNKMANSNISGFYNT